MQGDWTPTMGNYPLPLQQVLHSPRHLVAPRTPARGPTPHPRLPRPYNDYGIWLSIVIMGRVGTCMVVLGYKKCLGERGPFTGRFFEKRNQIPPFGRHN